jgi:hypothetical protein
MTITIERGIPYGEHPESVRLTNGEFELIVPTRCGPRIIRYGRVGGPNLFGEVSSRTQGNPTPFGDTWHIYGGHRLWHAPEDATRTYFPDNGPVRVEGLADGSADGLVVTQSPEGNTGIEKSMEIRLAPSGSGVRVSHRLTNRGHTELELAPWALTVMTQGGTAVFPQPPFVPHPQALAPARPLVVWPFTRMADPRWTWGDRYLLLRQDPTASAPQKVGLYSDAGWIAYAVGGSLFVKRHRALPGPHADFGCNVETFTDHAILELETLGPLVRLGPGAHVDHDEEWLVVEGVPAAPGEETFATYLDSLALRSRR